jgi:hypothetical protein
MSAFDGNDVPRLKIIVRDLVCGVPQKLPLRQVSATPTCVFARARRGRLPSLPHEAHREAATCLAAVPAAFYRHAIPARPPYQRLK